MSHAAALVYLYGPPAVGKLTVATELHRRTGFRLFHNHLTIDAISSVFERGTDAFSEVLHRMRLDVFETSAREGSAVPARAREASGAFPAERSCWIYMTPSRFTRMM